MKNKKIKPEPIVSVSGIRGIYGESLTIPVASEYALAFAQYCRKHSKSRKIFVGRDGREKGEEISAVVISVFQISGFEVTDIGVVPTPTVQIATEKSKAAGGIVVTASHNPQQWNGLKFLNSDGTFLTGEQIKELKDNYAKKNFGFLNHEKYSSVKEDKTWLGKHIKYCLKPSLVNISKVRKRKFKVVVDAVNAAGSVIVPELLRELGCVVIELFCDGSGIFPHTPEPIPENLTLLSKAVIKHKADLGISVDPDSDRLVIIMENGKPYIEEYTVVTVIRNVLKNSSKVNKKVAVNMSTTRAVEDVAADFGAKVFRSAVGEINVVNEMKLNGAIAGGEGSGGIIVPAVHYGRDAVAGICIVLNELSDFRGTVSEYKKTLPEYHIVKNKIEVSSPPDKIFSLITQNFSAKYKNAECKVNIIDGLKLDFPDYWIHLRKSNTEPIIRIITEAKTKAKAEILQKNFIAEVKKML